MHESAGCGRRAGEGLNHSTLPPGPGCFTEAFMGLQIDLAYWTMDLQLSLSASIVVSLIS
jgi:hypothetical protein